MKILFTGASSFTGMWFVKELVKAGHELTCIFQQPKKTYKDLKKERLDQIIALCEPVFECSFGSEKFIDLIERENFDLLCHHAADVTEYKSSDFDFISALDNNTKNIKKVLVLLKSQGCDKVLLTGSMFEQNEGVGSDRAVSPYGLSKGLTSDVFRYFTEIMGMKLGKFVIPTPFGPYEEPRFTSYLMRTWSKGEKAIVNQPDYIRDNIHISLLARAYVLFASTIDQTYQVCSPSQYRESNGAFTKRIAEEMRNRLSLSCEYELKKQVEFTEPKERANRDTVDLDWCEFEAWNVFADYYSTFAKQFF